VADAEFACGDDAARVAGGRVAAEHFHGRKYACREPRCDFRIVLPNVLVTRIQALFGPGASNESS
jgi:hypothetical protein